LLERVSKQHGDFLKRLNGSRPAVFAVAYWLNGRGNEMIIPPLKYAPSAADAADYVDAGDLFCRSPRGMTRLVEVKHSRKWLARDFPYQLMFVASVAQVERRHGQVGAYFVVSLDYSRLGWIKPSTQVHWTLVEKRAGNTGNVERNYACPVDHVIFVDL
jgi:hypothetical protein